MSNDYFVSTNENEIEEEDYFEGEDWGYESNAPCDTYGMCAGTSCPNFWKCHGK